MPTLTALGQFVLDLIFPRYCLGCRSEGAWLCPSCQAHLILIHSTTCCRCGRLSPRGICSRHRRYLPFTGALAAGYYRDPLLKEAIRALKYEGIRELAITLGQLLTAVASQQTWPRHCLLIPVPLNRWRQNNRGFNQAELLARQLSNHFGWPVTTNILWRARATRPQVDLSPRERPANVHNAFVVHNKNRLRGQTIILVDDVITTGATLGECARVLRLAGAKRIWVLTVAKS